MHTAIPIHSHTCYCVSHPPHAQMCSHVYSLTRTFTGTSQSYTYKQQQLCTPHLTPHYQSELWMLTRSTSIIYTHNTHINTNTYANIPNHSKPTLAIFPSYKPFSLSLSTSGHFIHVTTNVFGPFYLFEFLTPSLISSFTFWWRAMHETLYAYGFFHILYWTSS